MSNDIMLCYGIECAIKTSCLRYTKYTECQKKTGWIMTENFNNKNCEFYVDKETAKANDRDNGQCF